MNCREARDSIDACVHELTPEALASAAGDGLDRADPVSLDLADLNAHLAACPSCRADLEELCRVRREFAAAADDRPNNSEVQTMWTALQTAVAMPIGFPPAARGHWWVRSRPLVVSLVGTAAVLMLAFQLGRAHYGLPPFDDLDQSIVTASNVEGIGASSHVFFDHDSSNGQFGVERQSNDALARKAHRSSGEFSRADREGRDAITILGGVGGRSAMMLKPPPPALPVTDAPFGGVPSALHDRVDELRAPPPPTAAESAGIKDYCDATGLDATTVRSDQITQTQSNPSQPTRSVVPRDDSKIIKTGELTLQVPVYGDSVTRVQRVVAELGGFVADVATREEAGGAMVGRIVIRVSPERFEEAFAALKAVGRIESENVRTADVTAEYVDLDARIRGLQITEERLRDLIANKSFVDKIASLLEVEKEMNRVRSEIEQLQGQLRVTSDRVALSTIALTLREPARTVPSASLSVEVDVLEAAAQSLRDLLAETDGRVVSGKTSKRSDGTLMGNYQLETTLARFADAVSGVQALGRVEERQVKDQQFHEAGEPWADRVKCTIALVLFERSRQLPSASVRLEVDSLEEATKRLNEVLLTYGATTTSNQVLRQSDGSNAAELRLRVPAGQFAGLFESLSTLGRVISKTAVGETSRIVGGAAVVPCDLALTLTETPREVPTGTVSLEVETFETARQSLSRAIAEGHVQVLRSSSSQRNDGTWQGTFRLGVSAKAMESFVARIEDLGRVTARQVNGLGLGDLSRIDPDALCLIDVTVGERSTLAPAPDETSASIRGRVRDGLSGFYRSIGLIGYGLVVLLPWLVLAAVVGWMVTRIGRALRKRRGAGSPTI